MIANAALANIVSVATERSKRVGCCQEFILVAHKAPNLSSAPKRLRWRAKGGDRKGENADDHFVLLDITMICFGLVDGMG